MIKEIKTYQDSNGRWVSEIKDTRPGLNLLAFGTSDIEAVINVKKLHHEVLQEMLKTTVMIPLEIGVTS